MVRSSIRGNYVTNVSSHSVLNSCRTSRERLNKLVKDNQIKTKTKGHVYEPHVIKTASTSINNTYNNETKTYYSSKSEYIKRKREKYEQIERGYEPRIFGAATASERYPDLKLESNIN